MRPPPRSTRSTQSHPSSSSLSPSLGELSLPPSDPRPTRADIAVHARHRLRDGSISRASSSSRGSSVSSVSSSRSRGRGRGRSTVIRIPAAALQMGRQNRARSNEYDEQYDDYRPSPSPSLTPPPELPVHGSLLQALDNLDYMSSLSPPPYQPTTQSQSLAPQPFPLDLDDTPSVGSSSHVERGSDDGPRYTAQQKGKGRAVVPSPIEVDDSSEGDESFQVISVEGPGRPKRKREDADEDEKDDDEADVESSKADEVNGSDEPASARGLVDEEMGLGSYTCPVCFCQPERAVMTLCGHILCARCLLDSLLAALKRNPNPYPGQPPSNRGRGTRGRGSRGGGRGGRGGYSNSGTHSHFSSTAGESKLGGPTEWTTETLETAWSKNLEIQYLIINGALPEIARGYTDDDRKAIVPDPGYFHVIEVLKGLWKIEPGGYIVEGECPVCRKPLPGGFAPPDTGFGGVIPLQLRLGGIDNT